jgi:phage terminase large subunit
VNITLPNNWSPRQYQLPVFDYFAKGGKRAFLLWHRRSGKDDLALHLTACQAMQRVGNYWHMLPAYSQCRKALWEAINPRTGKRRIDEAFPDEICETKRGQDMFIRFINGSSWQALGSDNFDSLVGSPPVGLVFSEYALADPRAWAYLRPIIADNNGYALMITTPRGKNHAYQLYNYALENPDDWFCSKVTAATSGVFTEESLAREKAELISEYGVDEGEAIFNQEYFVDFQGAQAGSYFGSLMNEMDYDGRIGIVTYNPNLPVSTGWDIGVGDAMAIVFVQNIGNERRVIDYWEASGESLQSAIQVLKSKPYVYEQHCMPHDINVRVWSDNAKTRYQTALELGVRPITLVKRPKSVGDRVHIVRSALPTMLMDRKKCSVLIEHLKSYKKKWNPVLKMWGDTPEHGPESHGVDALGTLLEGVKPITKPKTVEQIMQGVNYRGAW